jgi:hypothetical protein
VIISFFACCLHKTSVLQSREQSKMHKIELKFIGLGKGFGLIGLAGLAKCWDKGGVGHIFLYIVVLFILISL